MVGCQVKYYLDAVHRRARHAWLAKIGLYESDVPALQVMLDIAAPAARKIVHYAHFCAALQQRIDEMRTDERCASGYKNSLIIPDGALPVFPERLVLGLMRISLTHSL